MSGFRDTLVFNNIPNIICMYHSFPKCWCESLTPLPMIASHCPLRPYQETSVLFRSLRTNAYGCLAPNQDSINTINAVILLTGDVSEVGTPKSEILCSICWNMTKTCECSDKCIWPYPHLHVHRHHSIYNWLSTMTYYNLLTTFQF